MVRKILFPLILGFGGVAVLLWLGFWQLDRLAWKEEILSEIDARLASAPVALPEAPTETEDEYRAVTLTGTLTGDELHVLTSGTAAGTGYRVISAIMLEDGRRVLLDQGLLPLDAKDQPPATGQVSVTGTLLWPDDLNSSTPDPDRAKNIWFARDIDGMSEALDTAPIMVVAREVSPPDPRLTVLPVDSANVTNDHLEYAITWFLLAAVWAAMTGFLIFRILSRKDA